MKRSVLRQLNTRREEVLFGAGPGEDCAILAFKEEVCMVSSDPLTVSGQNAVWYGIHRSANNIAASGGEPVAVLLTILLSADTQETELKNMMMQAETACTALGIQIAGGHTQVTAAVNQTVVNVTCIGKAVRGQDIKTSTAQPGMDLIVTKWIGLEGTSILAKEKKEQLAGRFPAVFMEEARSLDRYMSVVPEAAAAVKSGVPAMHDVSEGGIFGALWELAESSGVGLSIDLKKLPIRQETVEICNYLDLNPYELLSGGSLLIAAHDGHELAESLQQEGIFATVIGRTTPDRDRVVRNGEEKRFLNPAGPDELYKITGI